MDEDKSETVQRRCLQWTNEEDETLRSLAEQGRYLRNIALKLHRSEDGVRRRAERLSIDIRARHTPSPEVSSAS
jgi:uncharacterized heparinase superfamily protein